MPRLLVAVYACALGFYVSGIAITASGLAGANELVLNNPLHRVEISELGRTPRNHRKPGRTRVSIGEQGINIYEEKLPEDAATGWTDPDDVASSSKS